MKIFFTAILLVILSAQPNLTIAQQSLPNVALAGTISNYSNYKFFYYSDNLQSKTDTNQKVFVKDGNLYNFDLSKTAFKNKAVDKLYFGWELDKEGKIANGCYSEINIAAIRDYCTTNKLKGITLKNDFTLTYNCGSTIAEEFQEERKQFGGSYKMTVNDTTYILQLSTYMLSTFTGDYKPQDKNFCNKLWGWWEYKKDKNQLGIYTHYYINKDWGIYINANNPLYFTISRNESGKPVFKDANGKVALEKIN